MSYKVWMPPMPIGDECTSEEIVNQDWDWEGELFNVFAWPGEDVESYVRTFRLMWGLGDGF